MTLGYGPRNRGIDMKARIIVPKADNQGFRFSDDVIGGIEEKILLLFGAFTRSDVQGVWYSKAKKTVYRDYSIRYELTSDAKTIDDNIGPLCRDIGDICKQKFVYADVDGKGWRVYAPSRKPVCERADPDECGECLCCNCVNYVMHAIDYL